MLADIVIFFGIIIIILIALAEFFRHRLLGIVASVLLLILALGILIDGVQIQSGVHTTQSIITVSSTLLRGML